MTKVRPEQKSFFYSSKKFSRTSAVRSIFNRNSERIFLKLFSQFLGLSFGPLARLSRTLFLMLCYEIIRALSARYLAMILSDSSERNLDKVDKNCWHADRNWKTFCHVTRTDFLVFSTALPRYKYTNHRRVRKQGKKHRPVCLLANLLDHPLLQGLFYRSLFVSFELHIK